MDRLRLAQRFSSPAVKRSIDAGHAHCAPVSAAARPVDDFVRLAGDMLEHVHIPDFDWHWARGMGTVNWRAVFAAPARIGSTPRLNLELRDKAWNIPDANALEGVGLAR